MPRINHQQFRQDVLIHRQSAHGAVLIGDIDQIKEQRPAFWRCIQPHVRGQPASPLPSHEEMAVQPVIAGQRVLRQVAHIDGPQKVRRWAHAKNLRQIPRPVTGV